MRRSASEIIRNLEVRIARLERTSSKVASDFDPRKAIIYFEIHIDNDLAEMINYEEISDRELASMESKALKNVSRLLKVKVSTHGHDRHGSLSCNIAVKSLEEVAKIIEIVQRNTIGGEDQIDLGRYFSAQGFTLYPKGIFGGRPIYQIGGNGGYEDLEEYLEDQGVL